MQNVRRIGNTDRPVGRWLSCEVGDKSDSDGKQCINSVL